MLTRIKNDLTVLFNHCLIIKEYFSKKIWKENVYTDKYDI